MLEVFGRFLLVTKSVALWFNGIATFQCWQMAGCLMLINEEREFFGQAELRNSAQICPGLLCNKSDRLDYTEEEIEL